MKDLNKCVLIVGLFILLLVGCTDEKIKSNSDSPFTVEYEGQEYKVYTYFEEFLNYAEKAEEKPDQLKKHYKETVTEPFRKRAFANGEGHDTIIGDKSFEPPQDLEQLRKDVHTLQKREDNIHEWVRQSLQKSADTLSSEGADVHIFPVDTGIPGFSKSYQSIGGVTGKTYNEDSMVLRLTASFEKRALLNSVAHEYHHTVAYEKNHVDASRSLLHWVLIEGKAEMFAKTVYPDFKSYISEPFSSSGLEEEVCTYLEQNQFQVGIRFKETLMYGNREKNFPPESDYRIGRQIMESFVEHNPDIGVAQWTKMPAKEIMEKSDYEEKFQ